MVHLVVAAWLYVALTMAVAEAMSPVGSVLGAVITFVLYGALPLGIVVYILDTPARRRRARARSAAEPDRGRVAPGDPVAPERVEAQPVLDRAPQATVDPRDPGSP